MVTKNTAVVGREPDLQLWPLLETRGGMGAVHHAIMTDARGRRR